MIAAVLLGQWGQPALANTGSPLWASRDRRSGNSDGTAFALGVSPGGARVFLTGASWGSNSASDHATVANVTR